MLSDPRLTSPAPEILDHLARRGEDNIYGIQWFVMRACLPNLATKIAETVKELVEWGYLKKKQPPRKESEEPKNEESKTIYYVSPRYLPTLQQRPPLNCNPDDNE